MKILLLAAFAALTPAVSFAQQEQELLVDGRSVSLEEWSQDVTNKLDRALNRPMGGSTATRAADSPSGIVAVRFQRSVTGEATAVELAGSSGFRTLDRAALRAVADMDALDRPPSGIPANQNYVAAIMFSTTEAEHQRQMREVMRRVATGNAWFDPRKNDLVLAPSSSNPG